MKREDIIRMALDAGIYHEYDSEGHWDGLTNETLIGSDWLISKEHKLNRIVEILTPFAELVASAERDRLTDFVIQAAEKAVDMAIALEREACAKVCQDLDAWNMDDPASTAVKAIRARG